MDFPTRFSSTLNGAYTSGGGSIVLNSVTNLPSGACDFYGIVQAEAGNTEEVFHVTNVNAGTKTLTVTGAQDHTSASNHSSGAVFLAGIITSEVLSGFSTGGSGSISYGTRASRPSAATAGANSMYQCTDGPYTYISTGSVWQAFIGGVPVTEPLLGDFSQVNVSNFNIDDSRGGIYMSTAGAFGTPVNDTGFLVQTPPSAPYTIDIGIWLTTLQTNGFNGGGIFLRASGSGKWIGFYKLAVNSTNEYIQEFNKWNSPTSFSAAYVTTRVETTQTGVPMNYLRYQDDGTNRVLYLSTNPFNWIQCSASSGGGAVSNTDFITPDQLGFMAHQQDTINPFGIWLLHYKVTS